MPHRRRMVVHVPDSDEESRSELNITANVWICKWIIQEVFFLSSRTTHWIPGWVICVIAILGGSSPDSQRLQIGESEERLFSLSAEIWLENTLASQFKTIWPESVHWVVWYAIASIIWVCGLPLPYLWIVLVGFNVWSVLCVCICVWWASGCHELVLGKDRSGLGFMAGNTGSRWNCDKVFQILILSWSFSFWSKVTNQAVSLCVF